MAAAHIPHINWSTYSNIEALQFFKENIEVYCEDEDITELPKIALNILSGIEDEGMKRLKTSGLTDGDKRSPTKI